MDSHPLRWPPPWRTSRARPRRISVPTGGPGEAARERRVACRFGVGRRRSRRASWPARARLGTIRPAARPPRAAPRAHRPNAPSRTLAARGRSRRARRSARPAQLGRHEFRSLRVVPEHGRSPSRAGAPGDHSRVRDAERVELGPAVGEGGERRVGSPPASASLPRAASAVRCAGLSSAASRSLSAISRWAASSSSRSIMTSARTHRAPLAPIRQPWRSAANARRASSAAASTRPRLRAAKLRNEVAVATPSERTLRAPLVQPPGRFRRFEGTPQP